MPQLSVLKRQGSWWKMQTPLAAEPTVSPEMSAATQEGTLLLSCGDPGTQKDRVLPSRLPGLASELTDLDRELGPGTPMLTLFSVPSVHRERRAQ